MARGDWLLADFTFEAFGVVDASSCSNCFAFYLRPTLAAFLHVSLHMCEDHYHDDDHRDDYDDGYEFVYNRKTSQCRDSYYITDDDDDDVAEIYTKICMITM